MPNFISTEDFAYLNFSCFAVCGLLIGFLLVRHVLLLSGRLQPEDYDCNAFGVALLKWVKRQRPVANAKRADTRDEDTLLHQRISNCCTFGACVFFLLMCSGVVLLFATEAFASLRICHYAVVFNIMFFVTAKSCMYSVLVSRLHLGFKGTVYGYSQRVTRGLFALIAVWQLTELLLVSFFVDGEYAVYYKSTANDAKESGTLQECVTVVPLWVAALIVAFDVFFTLTVVYLFSSALKRMLTNTMKNFDEMSRKKDRKSQAELFLLPVKYTVITVVAVTSTLFAFVVYIISNVPIFTAVDSVLNCAALLLMTAKWKPVYAFTCNPLLRCVAQTPCFGCADLSHLELIGNVRVQMAKRSTNEL